MRKPKTIAATAPVPQYPYNPQEYTLIQIARAEPDERRRRFIVAVAHILPLLSADEMDKIEVHLRDAFGRVMIRQCADRLKGNQ